MSRCVLFLILLSRALVLVVVKSFPCISTVERRRTGTTIRSRKRFIQCGIFCYSSDPSIPPSTGNKTDDSKDSSKTMILPIFPLHKTVKLPTESIQLTLWEQRYIELSRCILDQRSDLDLPIFGALYSAHKSHIIKNGTGPITPLIDVGDIGVVCEVQHCSIFKNNETKAVDVRHKHDHDVTKIQLIGLAVGRFRVEHVTSNGYDLENGHLPYILVQASRVDDEEVHIVDITQDDETTKSMKERCDDFENLGMNKFRWSYQVGDIKKQNDQLRSFEMASKLELKITSKQMLHLLYSTSTKERQRSIRKISNSWWNESD